MNEATRKFSFPEIKNRGDSRPLAESLESMRPMTRGEFRWYRFKKRLRHPFKRDLFPKHTYIIDGVESE